LLALAAICGIAALAKRFDLPYPIAFVIGGAALAFVPNAPEVRINPDWIFTLILPPLLFAGGWSTDWILFRENLRPIGLLAIGLVVATTLAVAATLHALAPAIPWAAAFVLGAIVSPPDAVAAGAVFERFSVPRRIIAILDGEGLVNDATALVILKFAVAATLTGAFSLGNASAAFVFVALSGVGVGALFAVAFVAFMKLMRKAALSDYLVDNILSLAAPYAVYILADSIQLHGVGPSAVLATVTAGIITSRASAKIYDPEARLLASSVWELLIFLLNALAFLLIGLEIRAIVADPGFVRRELWTGVAISGVVIAVRIVWAYAAAYLPRLVFPSINRREGIPGWNYIFVIGWSGMRGVVSLAAALALPFNFPARNEILFVTFCVIFATLVFQGLSLIPLLKVLHIDGDDLADRELEVRIAALEAGIKRLRELEPGFDSTEEWEVEGRLVGEYQYRIAHLQAHLDDRASEFPRETKNIALDHKLQEAALTGERREVQRLRSAGEIPDEVYHKIEYDLDLAQARLT
jgi:CPA1 family monovalent cation:H+ antiporter